VSEERAVAAVSALRTTTIEPLGDTLALEAADVALEYGLAMADAIIFATASRHNAEIVTGDADFDGLPGVRLIR
jgi:predicted nucleic acid-binding protein